jgi:hypothetical protein
MNVHEGARRMQRAGKWLVMIPLSVLSLIWAIAFIETLLKHGYPPYHAPLIFLILFIYLAIPGGALWLAGWIVEGFAGNPD